MSRVSISRRLAALLESAERIDPQAAAVYRMAPATRIRYDAWRARCDQITAQLGGGAALYAHYVDTGEWPLPDPPRAVATALGLNAGPIVTDAMSLADLADAWSAMIES